MNKLINNFFDTYPTFYPEFAPERIRQKVKYGYHCDSDQVICHLNLINIETSAYYKFFKIVKSQFNLRNKNILEVACGYIPIVSSIFAERTNSKVTAINSKILFKNYKNVQTKEQDLLQNFDVSNFDLVVGFRPCYVTEKTIEMCFKFNKDFVLYLCPCDMQPIDPNEKRCENGKEWREFIIKKVRENKNYKVSVFSSKKLQDDMPIIVAKYIN